jgi:ATP-binding cassette subfamily C protein CydCD
VSFTLVPGEITGLTGASGAGKTTLVNLLLGFDEPAGGRITVGGAELADCDLEAWRSRIAWVPQHPRLTGATVAEAIGLGSPHAGDDDVARAAAAAGIDFPLDSRLGRDGTALSGGQARRVALARAILRDSPIVLLDEPAEHLDADTEHALTEALRSWLPGRTGLLISHRPALLGLCDTVVDLDDATQTGAMQVDAASRPLAVSVSKPAAGPEPVPERAPEQAPEQPSAQPSEWASERHDAESQSLRRRIAAAVILGAAATLCSVGLAAASAWLIATAALRPPLLTLQVGIAAVQAFGLGRALLRYTERLAGHDATLRLLAELRVRVYRGLLRRAPAGMSGVRQGDLLATLTADIDAVQDLFLKVLLPSAAVAVAGAGLVLFDAAVLPAAAPVLLGGLAVGGIAAPLLTRSTARRAEARTQTVRAGLADRVVDLLGALTDLVAYGQAGSRLERIAGDDAKLSRLERRGALGSGLGAALVTLASGATVATLAVAAGAAVRDGRVAGPLAAAVVLAPLAMFEALAALPDAARAADRGQAAWTRLRRVAEAPALVPAPAPAVPVPWTDSSVLEFEEVSAAWPDSDRLAVRDVSFRLAAGEHLTVTGPSGGGKSTLAHLASRGLDPVGGRVRIDGVDLRETDPEQVRRIVAVCGQDAHLFDTTVAENLRIGRPGAGDADLWRVLTLVGLDRWAAELPDGLETPVGQLGDAVSGGERQRIALARALLSPAPLLILDEPTAHLDAATAAAVDAHLHRELRHRTVIRISHDPYGAARSASDAAHVEITNRQAVLVEGR